MNTFIFKFMGRVELRRTQVQCFHPGFENDTPQLHSRGIEVGYSVS